MILWKMFFSHSNPLNFYCTLNFTVHQPTRQRGDSFNGWSQGKLEPVDHSHLAIADLCPRKFFAVHAYVPPSAFSIFSIVRLPFSTAVLFSGTQLNLAFCHVTIGKGTALVLHYCRVTFSPSSTKPSTESNHTRSEGGGTSVHRINANAIRNGLH